MLKRLYIDNVRCLQSFELQPGQVSALVGPNGGGKSTVFDVLEALQLFLGSAGLPARQVFAPASLTRWDSRLIQTVEMEVEEPGSPRYLYHLEIRHDAERRNAVVEERLTSAGQVLYRLANGQVELYGDQPSQTPRAAFPVDARRSFLPILESRPDNQKISAFKRWLSGMWLFRLRPERIVPGTREESESIKHDGSNFVSWYRTLQQESPGILESLRKDIQPVIPGLSDIRLSRIGDEKILTFDCEIGNQTFSLFLNELSEGQGVLLVLYTVMHALAGRATLLVFDEPDNFVADAEIQPWLSGLRDIVVSAQKGTLLVISHHPEVIDYLAADQVIQIWRDDGPARRRELEVDREKGLTASKWLRLGSVDG